MRAGLLLVTAALIAATPTLALLLLLATGTAAVGPALAALAAVLLASLLLALVVVRDLARLTEAVRHALLENPPALSRAAAAAWLAPVQRIARAIERLARTLAAREGQVAQGLRATETIIDRLPDPLLVLGADRAVRRTNAAARAAFGGDIPAVLRHPGLRAALDRAFTQGQGQTQFADLSLFVPVARDVQAAVLVLEPPLADGGQAPGDRRHRRRRAVVVGEGQLGHIARHRRRSGRQRVEGDGGAPGGEVRPVRGVGPQGGF